MRRCAHQGGLAERKAMIDRTHALPVTRQCQLLKLARSTAYYPPRPVSDTVLTRMRRIDELHLQYPFAGARMLRDLLRHEGHPVGRRQVATLMRRMGITAIYRMPRTSQRHPAHRIYPYLLRQLTISRPNHVWASDITYIPMPRGFAYLCPILDWVSRQVLACPPPHDCFGHTFGAYCPLMNGGVHGEIEDGAKPVFLAQEDGRGTAACCEATISIWSPVKRGSRLQRWQSGGTTSSPAATRA